MGDVLLINLVARQRSTALLVDCSQQQVSQHHIDLGEGAFDGRQRRVEEA